MIYARSPLSCLLLIVPQLYPIFVCFFYFNISVAVLCEPTAYFHYFCFYIIWYLLHILFVMFSIFAISEAMLLISTTSFLYMRRPNLGGFMLLVVTPRSFLLSE